MSVLGDVGGSILSVLYSYRIAAGALATVVLAILAVVARRRRWLARARRHPRLVALTGVPALLVGLPVAWYLFSPLLVRTTLEEPPLAVAIASPGAGAPTLALGATPSPASPTASPTGQPPSTTPSPTAVPGPMPTPWAASPGRVGTFQGTDDFHFGRGTAVLTEVAPGSWTLRLERFSVRNGPDLYVYLSPDPAGFASGAIELERLRATDGSFNVSIPPGATVAGQRSVLIWCKQFSHLFAYATLAP